MTKEELSNIRDWLKVNKLSTNPSKTKYMAIGHSRKLNEVGTLPSLELNQYEIKRVKKTKSLGIIIDEGLSWKDHYESLLGKLHGRQPIIRLL